MMFMIDVLLLNIFIVQKFWKVTKHFIKLYVNEDVNVLSYLYVSYRSGSTFRLHVHHEIHVHPFQPPWPIRL